MYNVQYGRVESVAAHCGPCGGGIPGGAPVEEKHMGATHTVTRRAPMGVVTHRWTAILWLPKMMIYQRYMSHKQQQHEEHLWV